jgi:hypothetical protein
MQWVYYMNLWYRRKNNCKDEKKVNEYRLQTKYLKKKIKQAIKDLEMNLVKNAKQNP